MKSICLFTVGVSLLFAGHSVADDKPRLTFELPDVRTGRPVALDQFKDRKAVVVVFIGNECPIGNLYMPRLSELATRFESKGVQFVGINANWLDSPSEVAAHAKRHNLKFPVLKDSTAKTADLFLARRLPEAFLLDDKGMLRYRGRIDDQFGYDFRRAKPTKHDLADAIDAVLNGKDAPVARTTVEGCVITRAPSPTERVRFTFAKDVAPIVQKHCQECHRPGQIGPMSLLTYDQVAGWSGMIAEVVAQKRMPPWFADPKVGHFRNDRTLADKDRQTLLTWIEQGCPKGDDKHMPPPVQFPEGWRIGNPDVVFTMKEEFNVPAQMPVGGVAYQYFVIETSFGEDKWIERAEARPGAPEVVHHIIAFVVPPRNSGEPNPIGPPLLPPIITESKRATILCGTAPGDMPTILRPGFAKKVPKGSKIVLQMHYTPNGKAQKDRSKIGLIFAKEPPKYHVQTVPIMEYRFKIPPGDGNHRVESEGPWDFQGPKGFPADVKIVSFMPHMHLRGKDFFIEAIYPDGKREPLLNVPKFNFNWQNAYRLEEPKPLPKGTILHCIAHFDNSADNPNNPDPKSVIRWGDQTWQEMMVGWTDFAVERK